jgi:hypothetical protein
MVMLLGCNKDEEVANPDTGLRAPTNLRAYSAGATSIGLLWDLSASESDPSFINYQISVKDAGGVVLTTQSASKGNPASTVSGLTEGVIYTFVVRSTATGGTISPDSASVRWSPARRLVTDSTSGPPIQVYELRSTNGASGLQFHSSGGYAKTQSLDVGNPDRILSDIYVDSVGGGAISLRNVAILGYPKNTFFSTMVRDATDLNDPQPAPPDTTSYQSNRIDIPTAAVAQARIVYARSVTDNKYVRILIQRNPGTGLLYYGSGTDRYVVLQLSYQNTTGNWFARPQKLPAPEKY